MKKPIIGKIFLLACMVLMSAAGFCANARAQGYLGADALLQQVRERNATGPGTKPNDDQSKLRDDLKTFSQNAAGLAPADAARQWLELVDRAAKIRQQAGENANPLDMPISGQDLLAALPPPADWGALARAIVERPKPTQDQAEMREIGLHLLAATLTGDAQGQNLVVTNLEEKANAADTPMSMIYVDLLQELSQALVATSADPDAALKSLEQQISTARPENPATLQVPNLVAQVGPQKAEAFLRKALVAPNVILQFDQPNATSRLAQKLGLELVGQMKIPQWGLVNSIDAVELYEAMDKQFRESTNSTSSLPGLPAGISIPRAEFQMNDPKALARVYYMLGLISRGQTQLAIVAAKQAKGFENYQFDNAFDAMDRAGYAIQLDEFLYQLLSQDPALPYWSEYVEFSAKAGQTDRMVALVRATLARKDLNDNKKAALHQILFTALLAADNVDEGVQEMRHLMTNNVPPEPGLESYNQGQLGAMLARIGVLMTNSEWTSEGITAAKEWLATPAAENGSSWETQPVITSLTQTLLELNRGPEAESVLAGALASATRPGNSHQDYEWESGGGPGRQILSALAVLYYKAGRYNDVLVLLQNSPDWGAKDLSGLFETDSWADNQLSFMYLHIHPSPLPVPFVAATALADTGRTGEAQRIDDALLNKAPELDRGYELLISLKGTNAIPQLDEMFKADQFQTRPLIWKAHLLQQEGQLEEAEKIVRQAIAIDPSDGEQGRGDRMRAYAQLAGIREARGDQKEADFYRQVVQAIRVSENADQFYMAGLLKRAIAMYEQGLDHFADAYCIQSRLAIQLAALGKTSEAAEHYRRAYELMPDSFGRVESHCFGCERVFDGGQAQNIAEKVFAQLVAERPNKPQVYYLLGYLQTEENRYNEAWTNFQTAVRLDPDYLNDWVKLQETSEQIMVPPKDKEDITFNILRLDPLQRHASADFKGVSDLTRLWNAVAVAEQFQPKPASNLFPLTASKIALEKTPNTSSERARFAEMMQSRNEHQGLSPARAVAETPFVSLAGELILYGNSNIDY